MNKEYKGFTKTQITRKCDNFGKSIEEEIRQATESKTPIETASPECYTPLKDGVLPQYDIRTDRQELALDATDKHAKSGILHTDEMPPEKDTQQQKEPTNVEPNNEK